VPKLRRIEADPLTPFVNRLTERQLLARELLGRREPVVVLAGDAGMGKSSLARAFTASHARQFSGGVYELDLSDSRDGLAATAAEVLGALRGPDPTLLIIENADFETQEDRRTLVRMVQDLVRPPSGVRVIVTVRRRDWLPADWTAADVGRLRRGDVVEMFGESPRSEDREFQAVLDFIAGHPQAAHDLAQLAGSTALRELLDRLGPVELPGIVGRDGRPLGPGAPELKAVEFHVASVSEQLLAEMAADPERMYQLSPRQFEEFMAELYAQHGYEVELTAPSKDGGVDFYATKHEAFGSMITVVEAKRYSPEHRVGVGLIRQLNGVVDRLRANAGVLVTTSFFTKGARQEQAALKTRIGLQDYVAIQQMLRPWAPT
jgi:restriction system protein